MLETIKNTLNKGFMAIIVISFIFSCITFMYIGTKHDTESKLAANKDIKINVSIKVPFDDVYQVFYDCGSGYNEKDSVHISVKKSDNFQQLIFKLPVKEIKFLRIDPGTKKGIVAIKEISIDSKLGVYIWTADEILASFTYMHNIENPHIKDDILYITTTGSDPILSSEDINDIYSKSAKNRTYGILVTIFITTALLLIINEIFKLIKRLNVTFADMLSVVIFLNKHLPERKVVIEVIFVRFWV